MTKDRLLTVSSSPHIKSESTTRTVMCDVLIALCPALIWSVYVFGWRSLSLVLISVSSCILFEFLFEKIVRRPVTVGDCSAAVTGVIIAFNLPTAVPFWLVVFADAFAIIIVKQLFGGIGKNVVNPAVAARVFVFVSFPNEITKFLKPLSDVSPFTIGVDSQSFADAVASATPLASLKNGSAPGYTLFDMILGNIPGCMGEISSLLLIGGGIYLIYRRVITWQIPVSFISTVALLTLIFPKTALISSYEYMLYEIFSGGLILGAVFMATDFATSPITSWGKVIFGVGCGALTVFIRYFGGYVEGVSFAIMIMNLLVWYIDLATRPKKFGGGRKKEL